MTKVTTLGHALLGMLAEGPLSGYDLARHFDRSLRHAWSASHSQIYPELARLAQAGLVARSDAGARGRTTYTATEAGIATVRAWLQSRIPERNFRSEWLLRIFFLWLLTPDDARAYLTREREAHLAALGEYERIAANFPPRTPAVHAARIALEAGLRLERAMIDWTDYALAEMAAR